MDPIERELAEAQTAYKDGVAKLTERRRRAVKAAMDAGWSQYRIAKLWQVRHNTIAAIVESIKKHENGEVQS